MEVAQIPFTMAQSLSGSDAALTRYRVELSEGAMELRHYEALTVAKTTLAGEDLAASKAAFRRLNDYVVGHNVARRRIACETPFLSVCQFGCTTLAVVMPRNEKTPPKPIASEIELELLPSRRVASLAFSGRSSPDRIRERTAELLRWVRHKGLKPRSETPMARLDSRFTLPWLKRHEVHVEVA